MLKLVTSLTAIVFLVDVGTKEPQKLDHGIKVTPQRVAGVRLVNGEPVRTTEWVEYNGNDPERGCCSTDLAFDCFGVDGSCPTFPADEGCNIGNGRWYFGPDYCIGMATNDMSVAQGFQGVKSDRVAFAWYWFCDGSGIEDCDILLFTGENFLQDCTGFGPDYEGLWYDFGNLDCNPGGYFFTDFSLCDSFGLFHQMPVTADGWYQFRYMTNDGIAPATCAQPMSWGIKDLGEGSQSALQYDDDDPRDGTYQLPTECYDDYGYGDCPTPEIGAMVAFFADADSNSACVSSDCVGGTCRFSKLLCRPIDENHNKFLSKGTGIAGDNICLKDGNGNFKACTVVNSRNKWKVVEKNTSNMETRQACGVFRIVNCP